jgi:hypothetical protein
MKVLYFWVEVGRGSGNGVEKIILTFITWKRNYQKR